MRAVRGSGEATGGRNAAPAHPPTHTTHRQTVTDVIYTCGDDIDATVRRLSELRLSRAQDAPPSSRSEAAAGPRRAASVPPPAASSGAPSGATTPDPASVDPWADALVREMAAATDVADAKARAATVLRAFEAAVLDRAGDPSLAHAARAASLERDAGLLKRAVALQASRLAAAGSDVAALRAELEAARARLSSAEMTNFALAAHLRAATDGHGRGAPPQPPPDVF